MLELFLGCRTVEKCTDTKSKATGQVSLYMYLVINRPEKREVSVSTQEVQEENGEQVEKKV